MKLELIMLNDWEKQRLVLMMDTGGVPIIQPLQFSVLIWMHEKEDIQQTMIHLQYELRDIKDSSALNEISLMVKNMKGFLNMNDLGDLILP